MFEPLQTSSPADGDLDGYVPPPACRTPVMRMDQVPPFRLKEALDESAKFVSENISSNSTVSDQTVRSIVRQFITNPNAADARYAVVTSGSTISSLNKEQTLYITSLTTGNRASISAEELLRRGYRVIFIHRTDSLMPFMRHFHDPLLLEKSVVNDDGTVTIQGDAFAKAVDEYNLFIRTNRQMITIGFNTIAEYILALRATLEELEYTLPLGAMNSVLVYLVAIVSEFNSVLPDPLKGATDKKDVQVAFRPIPRYIHVGLAGKLWGSGAFVAVFHVGSGEKNRDCKIISQINEFGNVRLVVVNQKATYRTDVVIYDGRDLDHPHEIHRPSGRIELETDIVDYVVRKHTEFIGGR